MLTTVGATEELELLLDELAEDDEEDELELLALLDVLGVLVELLDDLLSLLLDELVLGSTVEEVSADPELVLLGVEASAGLQAPKTIPIAIASVRKANFFLFFIRFSFLALCNMF